MDLIKIYSVFWRIYGWCWMLLSILTKGADHFVDELPPRTLTWTEIKSLKKDLENILRTPKISLSVIFFPLKPLLTLFSPFQRKSSLTCHLTLKTTLATWQNTERRKEGPLPTCKKNCKWGVKIPGMKTSGKSYRIAQGIVL